MKTIVIATIRPWNIENARKLQQMLYPATKVVVIDCPEKLEIERVQALKPEFLFFPHWSWKIPPEIFQNFESIGFHMTDLPFGRGGSPLQNLIVRKIYRTKISAIRITDQLDAGAVYLKRDFFIGSGTAEELYALASEIIFFDMIPYILQHRPVPSEQQGTPVIFRRRKPEQSNLKEATLENLRDIYDFIRMLDAEGYPRAFLDVQKYRIFFSEPHLKHNKVVGRFEIERR